MKKLSILAVAVLFAQFAQAAIVSNDTPGQFTFTPTGTRWTSLYDQTTPHSNESVVRTQYFTDAFLIFDLSSLTTLPITGWKLDMDYNATFSADQYGPFHDLLLWKDTGDLGSDLTWENEPSSFGRTQSLNESWILAPDGHNHTVYSGTGDGALLQNSIAGGFTNPAFLIQEEYNNDAYWKFFGVNASSIRLTVYTAAVPEPKPYLLLAIGSTVMLMRVRRMCR